MQRDMPKTGLEKLSINFNGAVFGRDIDKSVQDMVVEKCLNLKEIAFTSIAD